MEKHNPGENDLYMRTLELAQIDEDEYFSQVVHDDLDKIIADIREAHMKDSTTADAVNPSDTARITAQCCTRRLRVRIASWDGIKSGTLRVESGDARCAPRD